MVVIIEAGFGEVRHPHRLLGLRRPRAELVERIERRTRAMFAGGFIEEVEALLAAGYGPALRALSALGYRYIASALSGEMTMDQALEKTLIASRRYARRQMTWFKKRPDICWFEAPVDVADTDPYVAPLWTQGDASP